jgi:uncharacterized alkaline shock family protein YloU
MARFKRLPINTHEGKIVYRNGIVDGIVLLAVQEIPYVQLYVDDPKGKMRSKAIKCVRANDGIHVDVVVKIHYTQSVSDVAFKIQEAIRHTVETMTEYHVSCVNVAIRGVTFDEEKILSEKAEEAKSAANENQ